jgi:hypothetical protein
MSCNIGKCQRKDCIYRAKQLGSCDYILLTGHRRAERIKEICEMLETSESELFREVKENVCN